MFKKPLFYIILVGLLVLIGFGIRSYLYQPHEDLTKRKADIKTEALTLKKNLQQQPDSYVKKYKHKTVLISGTLTEIDSNWLILNQNILFKFNEPISKDLDTLNKIKVKGRFLGYDNFLGEINFDQSVLISP